MLENPAPFLAHWGVDAVLAGQPVRGLHGSAAQVSPIGGPGVVVRQHTFWLASHLVPSNVVDQPLTIAEQLPRSAGGAFKVLSHLPDGTGFSLLELVEVRP
jgi:hypothetical protein